MLINSKNNSEKNEKRHPLHAICPYFAMFPEEFVHEYIEFYTKKGDWVFDPFCGRGTTILESLILGRRAAGSDINPVAFCISRAKAKRPMKGRVKNRINILKKLYNKSSSNKWEQERLNLRPFFRRAFYPTTLRELLFLRSTLNWRSDRTDCFIAALVLGSLHGDMDRSKAYFSNQMPRTICLKPEYSLRYWEKRRLYPKKRKVFDMLLQKTDYRLKNLPKFPSGIIRMVDARRSSKHFRNLQKKVSLIITSPPYFNVTRYEEDQWLRLWFLGKDPQPTYGKISRDDRYESPINYWKFLKESWAGIVPLLKRSAKIVIRLGAIGLDESEMTRQLIKSVEEAIPNAKLICPPRRSNIVGRQSQNFLPSSTGCLYEMDYIFAAKPEG